MPMATDPESQADATGTNDSGGIPATTGTGTAIDPIRTEPAHWTGRYEKIKGDENIVKALSKYNSEEDALLGAYEAQKRLGEKVTATPDEIIANLDKLSDEQKAALLGKVPDLQGIPKGAEGYTDIEWNKGLPEGTPIDETRRDAFVNFCVSKRISKDVASALVEFNNQYEQSVVDNYNHQMREKSDAALKQLTDDMGAVEFAKAAETVKRFFKTQIQDPEKYAEFEKETYLNGIRNNPIIFKAILPAAQMAIGEGSTIKGENHTPGAKGGSTDWQKAFPNSGTDPSHPSPGING